MGHEECSPIRASPQIRRDFKNKLALWPVLKRRSVHGTADEWVGILEREEIPVGVVNTLDRVMKDRRFFTATMVLDLEGEDGARARFPATQSNLRMRRGRPHLSAHLGADTAAVLHEVLRLST